MMPLHYMRCDGAGGTLNTFFPKEIAQIQHIFYVSGLAAELFFSSVEGFGPDLGQIMAWNGRCVRFLCHTNPLPHTQWV